MRKRRPGIKEGWPVWKRRCAAFSWRTGEQCKAYATRGGERCRKHGCGGLNAEQAWKRYLLWVLLPESIRTNGTVTPVTNEEVEIVCNILAQYIVTGDAWSSEGVRMKAIEYLFDTQITDKHEDPASLLTHLHREDAIAAIRILRLNGLIK